MINTISQSDYNKNSLTDLFNCLVSLLQLPVGAALYSDPHHSLHANVFQIIFVINTITLRGGSRWMCWWMIEKYFIC